MEELTREAVLAAIEDFDNRGAEDFFRHYQVSRRGSYFIRHEGSQYHMKAIVRVALGFVLGGQAFHGPLPHSVQVREMLENDLRFDVVHNPGHA